MALWKPDQTFYPSARMAMQAPSEKLGYVVTFNPNTSTGKHDALCVLDLDPKSKTYSQVVGRAEVPNVGDELHHFGWNACSAALCPYAPHPHVERRYLLVPGLRSSRIYIFDTKPDPTKPKLVKTIEAEEIASRAGYSRPHTIHCGPDAIYVSALGDPKGDGPGGIFLLDHESFDVLGRWEVDRGPQWFAYDFWWHLGWDVAVTSEWGTPNMIENGVVPDLLLGNKYGHCDSYLEPAQPAAFEVARPRRREPIGARTASVARSDQDLRLRRRGDLDQGFVGVDLALASRQRRLESSQGD